MSTSKSLVDIARVKSQKRSERKNANRSQWGRSFSEWLSCDRVYNSVFHHTALEIRLKRRS